MEWYWIVLIVAGGIAAFCVLAFALLAITATSSWGRIGDLLSALWNLFWLGYFAVLMIGAFVASTQTSRPFAAVAAWLIGITVVLVIWAMVPPRSPRAFAWSILLLLVGLGFVVTDLAVEGRPLEILLWVPVIGLALLGFLYALAAIVDRGVPGGVRVVRAVFGLILIGIAYGISAAFAGWDLWDLVL